MAVTMFLFIMTYMILTSFFWEDTPLRAFRLRRAYVKLAIIILGIRIVRKGLPIDETALYVCNHRSFSDPIILTTVLNAHVIAKAEVSDMPLINRGARLTGILYVKRENKDSRTNVRNEMVATLKKGLNVLVYPEGTTNKEKYVLPLRTGTFIEARNNGFPIVPIVLEYKSKYDLWHNKGFLHQFFYQFGKLRTSVKLTFGPIVRDGSGVDVKDFIENWMNREIENMHSSWDSVFSGPST